MGRRVAALALPVLLGCESPQEQEDPPERILFEIEPATRGAARWLAVAGILSNLDRSLGRERVRVDDGATRAILETRASRREADSAVVRQAFEAANWRAAPRGPAQGTEAGVDAAGARERAAQEARRVADVWAARATGPMGFSDQEADLLEAALAEELLARGVSGFREVVRAAVERACRNMSLPRREEVLRAILLGGPRVDR